MQTTGAVKWSGRMVDMCLCDTASCLGRGGNLKLGPGSGLACCAEDGAGKHNEGAEHERDAANGLRAPGQTPSELDATHRPQPCWPQRTEIISAWRY